MLRLPFSGGRLSLHKGFLSATAAKLFPSFSGSNKLHKGRYSAPVCGFCPRIPVHVALAADSFVVGLRSASPSWPAAWGGVPLRKALWFRSEGRIVILGSVCVVTVRLPRFQRKMMLMAGAVMEE